ncbi:MAG: hypothetical protein WC378_10585 [Opitutaceae bacterium]|jgi:hypothetical protein
MIMLRKSTARFLALLLLIASSCMMAAAANSPEWTVFIANDTCPDFTWGDDEATTRKSMAELIRSHLDEMTRTDAAAPENRDHYTMVTHEALYFLERYPERKEELARRIKEGRMMLSPNLCNSLWGFQSAEGFIRNLYPALRLQRQWGMPLDVMHHIEYPGMPWGVPTLLNGCGVRWLTISFLDVDSTFRDLQNPPVFNYEGPDGSRIGVVMDAWASQKWNYCQGSSLLKEPALITKDWIPHYLQLGDAFPSRTLLAAGTHGDTHPNSAAFTREFAEAITTLNARPDRPAKLVNGTYAQFCRIMEETQQHTPFMSTVRGSFGDSWDSWPISLAKYATDARENERRFLATETLIALGSLRQPALAETTRSKRERAEWCWLMLSDHAWNGTDLQNQQENARLRRTWNEELDSITQQLWLSGWTALGLAPSDDSLTIFNSLGISRNGLVRFPATGKSKIVTANQKELATQEVMEDGCRYLYFVAPPVGGFALKGMEIKGQEVSPSGGILKATPTELEGPFYRLKVNPETGGLASLVHKATGAELVVAQNNRSLCQTVFFDGKEHTLTGVTAKVAAIGPVLARLCIEGTTEGIRVTNFITLYADLDRVDIDLRINKPISTQEQRLVQIFPVLQKGGTLKVETTGAVIRPQQQPDGDLLPGGDTRRCVVQGFIEVSSPGAPTVTIAPLDAFLVRQDLDAVSFEAIGNDQDYREVFRNQGGVTDFRFRYSLRAHSGVTDNAAAVAWSRGVATPLFAVAGTIDTNLRHSIAMDSRRAIPICLKPADDPEELGLIVRFWEIGEKSADLQIAVEGFQRAVRTDLLERDMNALPITDGKVSLPIRARGFAGLRLVP